MSTARLLPLALAGLLLAGCTGPTPAAPTDAVDRPAPDPHLADGCRARAEWTARLPPPADDSPISVTATPDGPVVGSWSHGGLDLRAYGTDGALRWQRAGVAPPRSEHSLVALDGVLLVTHGHFGSSWQAELLSLADGRSVWSGELGSFSDTPFYISHVSQEGAADAVWVLPVVETSAGWQATWLRPDGTFQPLGPATLHHKPRPWTVTAELQTVGFRHDDGSATLGAYRFTDGAELWSITLPAGHFPAGQADHLFFVRGDGHLAAHRHADGAEAWRIPAAEGAGGAGSGDVVLVRDPGGMLRRVHPDDGRTLWETRLLPTRWGQDVQPPSVEVGKDVLLSFQTSEDLGFELEDLEANHSALDSRIDVLDAATGARVGSVPYPFAQPPRLRHGMLADFVDFGTSFGYGVVAADGSAVLLCRPAEGGAASGDLLPGRLYAVMDGRLLSIPL